MCSSVRFAFYLTPSNSPPQHFQTNKENDRPESERVVGKRGKQPAAPLQVKACSDKNGTSSKSDAHYATATQKRVKTFIKAGREAAAAEKRPPRTQAVLREQLGKDNNLLADVPPITAAAKLGMYKGKVVESKIGALWKTGTAACSAETKTTKESTIKAKIPAVKNCVQTTASAAAAVQRPAQVVRSTVTSRFPTRPPARPVHSTHAAPRNLKKATFNEKPTTRIVRTEKVHKPASSHLSQYRLTIETAEERRYVLWQFGCYVPFAQNLVSSMF